MSGNRLFLILFLFTGVVAATYFVNHIPPDHHYKSDHVKLYHMHDGRVVYQDQNVPNVWWYLYSARSEGIGILINYDGVLYRAARGPAPSIDEEQPENVFIEEETEEDVGSAAATEQSPVVSPTEHSKSGNSSSGNSGSGASDGGGR
jgi:hypothetical protein